MGAGRRHLAAVLGAFLAGLCAQEFAPVTLPAATPTREVAVAAATSFRIVDGVALVATGERTVPMPATSPTGAVYELARVPLGTVVAACESGLFVCDAQHPVLDRADLLDGLPSGAILGAAADAKGRVWWCSARSFGVVDLRVRFGRAFAEADGLPPAPYRGVAVLADGRVVLHAASGSFAYRPDVGPGPQLVGAPPAAVPLQAGADGTVLLPVAASARGGATLRVRRRHHHLWRPLVDGRVADLRPGRQQLEIHAVDRDLRLAKVCTYAVDVPVPPQFDPRRLPGLLILAVSVLVLGAFATGGGGSFAERGRRALLRVFVLTLLLLQVAAAFAGYGRSWPFVGFSMYTENYHRDDVLFRPRLVGLRQDGTRTSLHEDEVGIVQDGYWQMLAEVVFGDDDNRRQQLFRRVQRRQGQGAPFVGFTLADGRIRLTANGPVDVAPTMLLEYRP